ncbi:MAG: UTP--glucose-1-phosphate uridylyltransferase [Deltaproteobacteria bacterium]|nr:UTP--glucose-1-phosphate uridylyltransferase [Deltaproteobacteria bacterium]
MKGVILAAGYGTRFLPASKTIPKEMFPLIDTPVIEMIIQEFEEAGIHDILVVTSRRKKPLEDYFDREVELETTFNNEGKSENLRLIDPLELHTFFIRQKHMAGTGDALLLTEPFVGNSPFVVAYPDDLLINGPSLTGQLMETYRKTGRSVLAVQEIPNGDISRYGVVDTHQVDDLELVRSMVEKPPTGTEPSRLVSFGRYLYTPEIFKALHEARELFHGNEGEFTQTVALNHLSTQGRVTIRRIQGKMLDVGARFGYLQAVIETGLSRKEFRQDLMDWMRLRLEEESKR